MRPLIHLCLIALFAFAGGCVPAKPDEGASSGPLERIGAALVQGADKSDLAPGAGPALWRLSDSDSEVWLLGSVHVLPPDLKWRSARINAAFKAADTIYFETPVDMPAQASIVEIVRTYGVNPPGVTLATLLSPADHARLVRICAKYKISAAAMENSRPWLVATQLSVAQVLAKGQATDSGVERVLDDEAKGAQKKRAFFETSEQQIRFLADLPSKVETEYLAVTLRQIEEDSDDIRALDEAWARGDMKKLSAELNSEMKETGPEVYGALISTRNKRWAEEIDKMMKGKGKIFITVGAAHLIGAGGVPELLREKGYKVEGP